MQRRRRRGIITLRNCADYENVENPAGETAEGGEEGANVVVGREILSRGGEGGRGGGRVYCFSMGRDDKLYCH